MEGPAGYKVLPGSEPAVRASLAVSSHTGREIILYDPEIIISQTSLTVEEENPFTYTVRLDTEPTVEVTVGVSGHVDTDIILETTTLTFTPTNWNIPQTVTAVAGNDFDGVNDNQTLTYEGDGGEYDRADEEPAGDRQRQRPAGHRHHPIGADGG